MGEIFIFLFLNTTEWLSYWIRISRKTSNAKLSHKQSHKTGTVDPHQRDLYISDMIGRDQRTTIYM